MNIVERYAVYRIAPGYMFVRIQLGKNVTPAYWNYHLSGKILVAKKREYINDNACYLPMNRVKDIKPSKGSNMIITVNDKEKGNNTGVILSSDRVHERPYNWDEYLLESSALNKPGL